MCRKQISLTCVVGVFILLVAFIPFFGKAQAVQLFLTNGTTGTYFFEQNQGGPFVSCQCSLAPGNTTNVGNEKYQQIVPDSTKIVGSPMFPQSAYATQYFYVEVRREGTCDWKVRVQGHTCSNPWVIPIYLNGILVNPGQWTTLPPGKHQIVSHSVTYNDGVVKKGYFTLELFPRRALMVEIVQNVNTNTVSVTGGTPPYATTWSPMQDTVLVTDANGCSTMATGLPPLPCLMTLNVSDTLYATCDMDSTNVEVTIVDGSYPFTNASGDTLPVAFNMVLPIGVHGISVTDANGCVAGDSVAVVSVPMPTIQVDDTVQAECHSDSALVVYTTQTWNSLSMTTDTFYQSLPIGTNIIVIVDNNNCTGFGEVVVTPSELPTLNVTVTDNTVTVTSNGTVAINGIPLMAHDTIVANGLYTITATSADGCTVDTIVVVENRWVSTESIETNGGIVLTPNPTSDCFTVTSESETKGLYVYSMDGILVGQTKGNRYCIGELPSGLYIVKVIGSNGSVCSLALVKL